MVLGRGLLPLLACGEPPLVHTVVVCGDVLAGAHDGWGLGRGGADLQFHRSKRACAACYDCGRGGGGVKTDGDDGERTLGDSRHGEEREHGLQCGADRVVQLDDGGHGGAAQHGEGDYKQGLQ